ncbi:FlgD immunoglobulin-like domain containing protein [Candidatus Eisenbacteria bacterium]|uniref:FlgD immunoglobulin-like domain containing protein n=1 Tax=Eiseniibacteriota bacterium TaxID=2212470 RepID=A0ABV6YL91_UNCEI
MLFKVCSVIGAVIVVLASALSPTEANPVSSAPVECAPYDSIGPFVVGFQDVAGDSFPGVNYDEIFTSGGVALAERFIGQVLSYSGDNDVLSGTPTSPLLLQVGLRSQNLAIGTDTGNNGLYPYGPQGFPNADGYGEGSFAVQFLGSPVSAFGLMLFFGEGSRSGPGPGPDPVGIERDPSTYVQFFRQDGSLIAALTVGVTGAYGFEREGGVADIAGVSVHTSDPGGLAYDNLRYGGGWRITGRDVGTGKSIAAKWSSPGAMPDDATQAYLSDLPGGQTGSFLLGSPLMSAGQDSCTYLFEGLDPYVPYYLSFRTQMAGEWSDYVTPDPDSAFYSSVPTFCVHGWKSNPEMWGSDESGPVSWLRERHVSYVYKVTGLDPHGVPGEVYYEGNAERLSGFIEDRLTEVEEENLAFLGQEVPITSVDLMGHSMGGLIARRYISGYDSWAALRDCRKLVTLATPHRGTYLGDVACALAELGPPGSLTAPCELGKRRMAEFNTLFGEPGSAEVCVAGGTGGLTVDEHGMHRPNPDCGFGLNNTAPFEAFPNDGIVSLESALGVPGTVAGVWRDFEHEQLLCHSSIFWTVPNVFDYWVLPILTDPYREEGPALAGDREREDALDPQVVFSACQGLGLGEEWSGQFWADAGGLYAGVLASDSLVILTLEDPVGTIHDPESVIGDPNIEFYHSELGRGYFVTEAMCGEWTVHVSGDSIELPSVAFCATATVQNEVFMTTSLDMSQYELGDSVHIEAVITEAETPVVDVFVNCTVFRDGADSDTIHIVELLDDGLHDDGQAGDGVYGASFSGWDSLGVYVFAITADGAAPVVGSFHREAEEIAVATDQNPAGVADGLLSARASFLAQVLPNPSRSGVQIDYVVSSSAPLVLEIFDARGRCVRSIVTGGSKPAGIYKTTWDGTNESGLRVAGGIYWIRLKHAGLTESRAFVILR